MPGLHYLDNSYGNLDTASRMGSAIGNVARSRQLLPLIQYQQMLRQQALQSQMQLNAAHEQLFRAQSARSEASRLYDMARREKIQKELENAAGLRKAVEGGFEDLPSIGVGGAPMMVDNPDRAVAGATAQMLPANSDLAKQVMQLRAIGTQYEPYVTTGTKLPSPNAGFTLAPGSTRFDASGSPIATAPAKPPTEKDPVAGLQALNLIATDDLADPKLREAVKSELARRIAIMQGRGGAPTSPPPAMATSTNAPAATSTGLRYTVEPMQ